MKNRDEISSTAKLLEIIRDKGVYEKSPGREPTAPPNKKRFTTLFSDFLLSKKTNTVGVVISENNLTMVMTHRTSGHQPKLVNFKRTPLKAGFSRENKQFPTFLKSEITDFCGDTENVDIWSSILSEKVETRYIKIPKVPSAQIANAVFWTIKKQTPFVDREVIFDYSIVGEVNESGGIKYEIIALTAPRQEVDKLSSLFAGIGFPLSGISIVPFALQNLFKEKWLETEDEDVCTLYIGKDWSRIDIFSNNNLILTRDIKTGMESMVEAIRQGVSKKFQGEETGQDLEIEDLSGHGEDLQVSTDKAWKLLTCFIKDPADPKSDMAKLHLETEDVFQFIVPVLERLIKQVERTHQHYQLNFHDKRINTIYITGEVSSQERIVGFISEQLDVAKVESMNPFPLQASVQENLRPPTEAAEQDCYTPAAGLSLSYNDLTPNFIYTYEHKETQAKISNINRLIFACFIAGVILCASIYFWQGYNLYQKSEEVARLQNRMNQFDLYADKKLIMQMVNKKERKNQTMKEYAVNYLGIAVISELSLLTPENIRLLSIHADLIGNELEESKDNNKKKILLIEGVIIAAATDHEAMLKRYLLKLKNSPIFVTTGITNKSVETYKGAMVLRFNAKIELV